MKKQKKDVDEDNNIKERPSQQIKAVCYIHMFVLHEDNVHPEHEKINVFIIVRMED